MSRAVPLGERVRSSLWFVPFALALCAILCAIGALSWDRAHEGSHPGWAFGGTAAGAQSILSSLVGALVTVTGLTFSITVAALSFSANALGPRLLRRFVRNRWNQGFLGSFVGATFFCIIVLTATEAPGNSVPRTSVTLGIGLATMSFVLLIVFLHHVVRSIQADSVVSVLGSRLRSQIRDTFSLQPQETPGASDHRTVDPELTVSMDATGYVFSVDHRRVVALAEDQDAFIVLHKKPGHFVTRGEPLAEVFGTVSDPDSLSQALSDCIVVGPEHNERHDVEHAIREILEIALRSLARGTNDPFTATVCVDHLGAALAVAASRYGPGPLLTDQHGRPRVLRPIPTFGGMMDTAWHQLRQLACKHLAVSSRMLEALRLIAFACRHEDARLSVRRHAALIRDAAQAEAETRPDRRDLHRRYQQVLAALKRDASASRPSQSGERD